MSRLAQIFTEAIKDKNSILITTHLFPDADGIGAQIALCLALREMGKKAYCVNEEDLLSRYQYLDTDNVVQGLESFKAKNKRISFDLVIVVDTNTIFRTGQKTCQLIQSSQNPVLYIDHHPCADHIKNQHCIDTSAAATGQVVGELIEEMGVDFTQKIALPLYTAILIDTSSFRYPTVSAKTHSLIAKLMATGIEPPRAYNGIYGIGRIEHIHLLGKVLSSTSIGQSGKIAWMILKKEDLAAYGVDSEDTHAFINNLLILDKIKVACMFRDDGHQVKVSFRSTGEYDVGAMATALGGGGHSHSAATIISVPIEQDLTELIKQFIQEMEDYINQN